jgi:hypothetical protein
MLTIEFVVVRNGHRSIVERVPAAADRLVYAQQAARDLLGQVRRRHPDNPPDGFQIVGEDGMIVLRSWEKTP